MIMIMESELVLIARICLGVVFITSGIGKFANWSRFAHAVREYNILPAWLEKGYALLMMGGELILGIMILFGVMLFMAALGLALLLLGFAIAIVINLMRKRQLECNCYGILDSGVISGGTVLRIFLLLLLVAFVARFSQTSSPQTDLQLITAIDTAVPIILLVSFSLIILRLPDEFFKLFKLVAST